MSSLWTRKDGRLKIGSVSVALFVTLLALVGGLMQLNQPVDEALVQVKHIFRAEKMPKEEVKQKTGSQVEPSAAVAQPSVEVSETVVNQNEILVNLPVAPAEQQPDERGDAASGSPVSLTSVEDQNEPARILPVEAATETVQTVELKPEEINPEEINPQVKALTVPVSETATGQLKDKSDQKPDPFQILQQNSITNQAHERQTVAVTLSPEQYANVFRAWRTSSSQSEAEAARPGLLVDNLRQVYPLFQMKPVALIGGVAYDLEDGSRLAERSLDRYTATVFEVARPWDDWGTSLRRIGLRPGDDVEVRYYMHAYVHNGIYGRCAQAIAWGKVKGQLPADINAAEIEVRGRAYAVQQQGGGEFGVFIPNQLRLVDGRLININPEAFAGAADVALLQAAKVL